MPKMAEKNEEIIMNGRIKNIFIKIKKYSVTLWMVASLLALSALYVAYAAYNGTADVKRVISTQASSSTVFSSNYMDIYSASNPVIKNLRTINEGNFICTITVCNYDQLDPTNPARGKIDYSFTAELVSYDSNTSTYVPVSEVQMNADTPETFYVQKTMDNNMPVDTDTQHSINSVDPFSYTYESESLAGGVSSKDTFDICFDAAEVVKDMPVLYIKVTATPTAESIQLNSGINTLSSIISISQGRSVETGWHGSLQEENIKDYDGYNLIIEGSGSGTIDICWDDTKFAMNPAFVTLYGSNGKKFLTDEFEGDQTGWKKRTLTVNSMVDNRYVVQFYKRDTNVSYVGNNFASIYIRCNNYIATVVEENQEP